MRLRTPLVVVLDAALVALFSVFGRGAHSEGLGPAQVWNTAWPFLVGLGLGWVLLLAGRRDPRTVRSGVLVWLCTLVGGMAVWGLREGRVPHWSFVLVAGTATALFLVGWRALAGVVDRRRVAARA